MQNIKKVDRIKELCSDIINLNQMLIEAKYGTYYDYEKVIGLLEQVMEEMSDSRTPRPADLPEDMAWSEAYWNGEQEPDPFVFDGTMSVEDFEEFQNKCLIDPEFFVGKAIEPDAPIYMAEMGDCKDKILSERTEEPWSTYAPESPFSFLKGRPDINIEGREYEELAVVIETQD